MPESRNPIRIGTRTSRLARWQAEHVAAMLRGLGHGVQIEWIETTGDLDRRTDFGSLGAKGIFVKEIEAALLEDRIDLAVHSLKDLPTRLPDGLVLGAVLERERPFDVLISRDRRPLPDLKKGARVATGSLRRAAQLLAIRPDLEMIPIRGNVPTRVRKIRNEGAAEATLLAEAGLRRLGLGAEIDQVFDVDQITPAMGQGAIGVEARAGRCLDMLAAIDHAMTRRAVEAERLFLSRIGGGCKSPVGVFARRGSETLWSITAMLASADGKSLVRETREAPDDLTLPATALELAESLLQRADEAILETLSPQPVKLTGDGAL